MADASHIMDAGTLASALGNTVPERLLERLLGMPRFNQRLHNLALSALPPRPDCLNHAQQIALDLDELALRGLALHAGAIIQACAIGRMIEGDQVRQLVARIGPQLRLFALRRRYLSPDKSRDIDPVTIADSLEPAGFACIIDWCGMQPDAVAEHLRFHNPILKAGHDREVDEAGAAIVQHLLDDAA